MAGIWFGMVSVVVPGGDRHNHFYQGIWRSREEALGWMVVETRKKHPQGPIEASVAYRVEDELVRNAASYLENG